MSYRLLEDAGLSSMFTLSMFLGSHEACELLLRHGASTERTDKDGLTGNEYNVCERAVSFK